MDEKPDQILGHIEAQRSELSRNLNELETRVRRGTDWRTYFDSNPLMMLGAALGGGLLLGTAVGRRRHQGWSPSREMPAATLGFATAGAMPPAAMGEQRRQVSETMDLIRAALVGFGIAKAKEFMNHAIPGFERHMSDAEQRHQSRDSRRSQAWDSDVYGSGGADNSETYVTR